MEKEMGVPVVCENKPGAAGALAFSFVTRRQPDGYTIGHGPVEIAMVRTLGFADVGPDDMELLCLVSKAQPALAVNVDAPWRSLQEFVAAVRQRPAYYVMGNSGTGSIWHVNALLLERETGLKLVHCPFGGSSGALTALLGGHVDAVVAGVGEVGPHVEAKRLRVLATLGEERSKVFPGTPSVTELGYAPGASAWSGFFGPKGMEPGRRERLVAAIRVASESPDFRRVCAERGMEPIFLDSRQFREFALSQARFFGETIPELLRGGGQ
jgi:tripartite-type tricarboxylate transporter receptor subunit TctC